MTERITQLEVDHYFSGWSMECLEGWGEFINIAIPGMLMLCMEFWCFEIGVFLSGIA